MSLNHNKSLSSYTEKAQSALFEKMGAFFAFSNSQVDEKKKDGVKYVSIGKSGLICPKENADTLMKGVSEGHKEGIKLRLKDHSLSDIIQYELHNHECQITYDYSDAMDALEGHGVTEEMMKKEFSIFMDYCRENDLF